ncbi:hypothetical protein PLICRDRAFT_172457 [Plicaturopsis crispa FD-325 SS-3]|nr:hypothetical protein PLICRDRAFT_172457 [Plicaturopsis crispa FD-325 SS-3]
MPTPVDPSISSASSLSSSFSSSTGSSMLPATLSNSSQSDIVTSDHPAYPAPTPGPYTLAASRAPPRSSSVSTNMGQNFSRPQEPPSHSSSPASRAIALGNTAAATGLKLKRAFAGRRKPSNESIAQERLAKGKEREDAHASQTALVRGNRNHSAKQISLNLASQVFSGRKRLQQPISPDGTPPAPPPKPVGLQARKKQGPSPLELPAEPRVDNRASILVSSPNVAAALRYMHHDDAERLNMSSMDVERGKDETEKEAWRKSDSATSHHTVRAGATAGTRPSRPVSFAESLHSTHTIVPVNRRLSALVMDAEFATPEEDSDVPYSSPPILSRKRTSSPSGSAKSRNRRSMSLDLGTLLGSKKSPTPRSSAHAAEVEGRPASRSVSEGVNIPGLSSTRDTPTLTRAAANGIISPSSSNASSQSTGNNVKGRLAAYTAVSNGLTPPSPPYSTTSSEHSAERVPPSHPQRQRLHPPGQQPPPSFRQTAISMTSGFAPAAGLAKRAVEKMGRAWGGMGSSSGSSVYSSSSSNGTAPSSFSSQEHGFGRKTSSENPSESKKGKKRTTPNPPSGGWSGASSGNGHSSSLSDFDGFMTPSGPLLGTRLRGPMRLTPGGAGVAGGIVFGRDLKTCARETAVSIRPPGEALDVDAKSKPKHHRSGSVMPVTPEVPKSVLETRALPALVVRCAQHLMAWGVQEEGLFRVSGRPSHVAKLRAEFDTGADYDMSECSPGDLDPHAVSSIFKAYLRELPEPILTHALMPYFDAAMTAESNSVNAKASEATSLPRAGMRGPGLPTGGPKGGALPLRKPPSLSTLAMPNFSGLRPPSDSLISLLASLIARLPQENRDLIRTVTELIRATAKRSKETKMPLSNLLLVFCPSLNMSPPLLRVLCEAQGIWEIKPSEAIVDPIVMDIRPQNRDTIINIGVDPSRATDNSDRTDGSPSASTDADSVPAEVSSESEQLVATNERPPLPSPPTPEIPPSQPQAGSRPLPRPPVSTVYMDAREELARSRSGSGSSAAAGSVANAARSATSSVSSLSYVSTSEDPSLSIRDLPNPHLPPELSTSSAESLVTPSTSSGRPSFSEIQPASELYAKQESSFRPMSPVIADSDDRPLPTAPSRPSLNSPIQFPSVGSTPSTPISRRKSIPFLSLPGSPSKSEPGSPNSSPLSTARVKKPSLHLLFSKRSSSVLRSGGLTISAPSPYLQPHSASGSSYGMTPVSAVSMVTAPQCSSHSLPPTLDLLINSSPLQFDLDTYEERAHDEMKATDYTPSVDNKPSASAVSPDFDDRANETPIADTFRSAAPQITRDLPANPVVAPLRVKHKASASQSSVASLSTTSIDRLGLGTADTTREDDQWAQSVLMAADAHSLWSTKEAGSS